jgi:hypothetical protein
MEHRSGQAADAVRDEGQVLRAVRSFKPEEVGARRCALYTRGSFGGEMVKLPPEREGVSPSSVTGPTQPCACTSRTGVGRAPYRALGQTSAAARRRSRSLREAPRTTEKAASRAATDV